MFLAAADPSSNSAWTHLPDHWPAQVDLLTWCQTMSPGAATLLVLAGLVYLLFGWCAFKGLVAVNAALVGGCLGAFIADRLADSAPIGAVVGAVLMAATTLPMMKYAVALMGGTFGALLGAALWRSSSLEPNLAWAGALVLLVAFGLLSFIIFNGSVMMYTSLQGAVMLIFGLLGLAFKYQSVAPRLVEHMQLKPFLLPLAIFIPTVLGLIFQQTQAADAKAAASAAKKK